MADSNAGTAKRPGRNSATPARRANPDEAAAIVADAPADAKFEVGAARLIAGDYTGDDLVLVRLSFGTFMALHDLGLGGEDYVLPEDSEKISADTDEMFSWLLETFPQLEKENATAISPDAFQTVQEEADRLRGEGKSQRKQIKLLLKLLTRAEEADDLRIREIFSTYLPKVASVILGLNRGVGQMVADYIEFVRRNPEAARDVLDKFLKGAGLELDATELLGKLGMDVAPQVQPDDTPVADELTSLLNFLKDYPQALARFTEYSQKVRASFGAPGPLDAAADAPQVPQVSTVAAAEAPEPGEPSPHNLATPPAPAVAADAAPSPAPVVVAKAERQLPDVQEVAALKHEAWMERQRDAGNAVQRLGGMENLMVPFDQLSQPAQDAIKADVQDVLNSVMQLWEQGEAAGAPAPEAAADDAGQPADAQLPEAATENPAG